MTSIANFSFLLIASAALTACGGGGGGAEAPANAPGAAAPAPVIVPAAPTGYAAGSPQGEAFALLNAERSKCGFGSLTQNVALDQAATSHAQFLVERGVQYGHYEAAGEFFTGVTEQERAIAAGYADHQVGAVLAVSNGSLAASSAYTIPMQVRDILGAPYHLLAAIDDYGDGGVGFASKVTGAKESKALNITLGKPGGSTPLDASQVYTYPCSGSINVTKQLANESPSAIPLNLAQDFKLYGSPIAVRVRTGKVLTLTSATITPTAGGAAVANLVVSMANTPQPALMRSDSAYVLPLAPLAPNTSFVVQLAGTNDAVAFTRTFSFTTAN